MLVGLVLCLTGEFMRKIAMLTAGRSFNHYIQMTKDEDHHLVTHGIYAWSRHPSYVGWFYWSVGTQVTYSYRKLRIFSNVDKFATIPLSCFGLWWCVCQRRSANLSSHLQNLLWLLLSCVVPKATSIAPICHLGILLGILKRAWLMFYQDLQYLYG